MADVLLFAAVLGYVGCRLNTQGQGAGPSRASRRVEAALRDERAPELDWQQPVVEPLSVAVGYKLVGLVDPAQGEPLAKRIKGVRQSLSEAMGLLLPAIQVRDDLRLRPTQYTIVLSGTVVAEAEVARPPDGDPVAQRVRPAGRHSRRRAGLRHGGDLDRAGQKAHALGLGYQVVEVPSAIATHVSKVVRDYLPDLFRHEDVPAMMERLAALSPKLAAALDKALTHTQLLRVFRVLLAENVSLKDIVVIATTLLDSSETTKDPILLAAEVRCALRRQIVSLFGKKKEMRRLTCRASWRTCCSVR